MSLPTPKLDDIDFDTLREEAIGRIPELCPAWTDFNPSDPGITLIELMAWMTELMLYRLNRVPEKNYIKFLELMGVKLKPPRPARSWVQFELAKGAKEEALPVIEAGTRVSTKPGGGGPPVVFETVEPLNLTTANLRAVCSRVGDWNTDHSLELLKQGSAEEEIFGGSTRVSHCLYLGSKRFEDLPEKSGILVWVAIDDQPEPPCREIEWEAWDGIAWAPVHPSVESQDPVVGLISSGKIAFQPDFKLEPCPVDGVDSFWLRARLLSAQGDEFPPLSGLQAAVSLSPDNAQPPDAVLQRSRVREDLEKMLQPVDVNSGFEAFGSMPEPDNELYIFSPLFGRQGATCQIRFVGPRERLGAGIRREISWEYWCAEERWRSLGSDQELLDSTNGLTGDGTVTFIVPQDVAQPSILGHSGYAIRACLKSPAVSDAKRAHPTFSAIRITFEETPSDFDAYIREVYGAFEKIEIDPGAGFHPFPTLANEGPAFCLALDSRPSSRTQRIYFKLDDQTVELPPRARWEYWMHTGGEAEGKWCELPLRNDTTRGLSTSGALDFLAPADWQPGSPEQGVEGYWMRARRVIGELPAASVLKGLYLNATEVLEGTSNKDSVLGSSNGELCQTFSIDAGEGEVLPGVSLLVRELEKPGSDEVRDLKKRLRAELKEEKDEIGNLTAISSRWHQVENFFESRPDDCHYIFDERRGIVTFGDGRHGRIPPIGTSIVAEHYSVGGGTRGNVGQGTITVLEVAKDFVTGVRNVEPAQGGTDAESIEAAKLRGPWALRHRYRAVTREDFEHLAKEASTEVALAKCFLTEDPGVEGEAVLVVIVPKAETVGARPQPSSTLIRTVRDYLDERRLLTTRLQVLGPEYDDLDINVDPFLKKQFTGRASQFQEIISNEVNRVFDPLKGGPEGNGWPMGRTVHISELYYLLEQIEGIDYIKNVGMARYLVEPGDRQKKSNSERKNQERIQIGMRSFPYCRQLTFPAD